MDSIAHTAAELLYKGPSPALTLEELQKRLEAETPSLVPGPDQLLRALQAEPERIRVLLRPQRPWPIQVGPRAWVVPAAPALADGRPIRSIDHRLRKSIIALGADMEPGSMRSWARWNLFMTEERRVQEVLLRSRLRPEDADASPRGTTPGQPATPRNHLSTIAPPGPRWPNGTRRPLRPARSLRAPAGARRLGSATRPDEPPVGTR